MLNATSNINKENTQALVFFKDTDPRHAIVNGIIKNTTDVERKKF